MIDSGRELRSAFLEYFKSMEPHRHPVVESAPLVPPDDPTLLFTTAGMVQFKNLYSGMVEPLPYPRAASCQKCLRAGGKGSDLENVGKTLRHHTFFEMLGNFSFGDYFKREAVRWAWRFVTEQMGLPRERLFPTVFLGDDEAAEAWREETDTVYTPVRLDEKENFWGPAGDTGACGPCSEVCFFMGTDEELAKIQVLAKKSGDEFQTVMAKRIAGEGDTFLEIWNMVFPQFDQQRDGSRLPLKYRGIDTGAGLERMTTAMNRVRTGKVTTPYETDLMWPIVEAAASILNITYKKIADSSSDDDVHKRLAVNAIADHARALVFTLAEGITPSNIGRGYVLRRIQRRALRFASLLGQDDPFMARLYDPVVETMGDVYPEIKKNPDFIRKALQNEEETFLRTRDRGNKILSELFVQAQYRGDRMIPGKDVFRLWDTYGFPVDMTLEIAADQGLKVDMEGYHKAMSRQKEEARKSWKGGSLDDEAAVVEPLFEEMGATKFLGYDTPGPAHGKILGTIRLGTLVDRIDEGDEAILILDQTPFYAEAGGQIGDSGVISHAGGKFIVHATRKTPGGMYFHIGKMSAGWLRPGEEVEAEVDSRRRRKIIRNHSSVHLLQSALKRLIGDHVTQAGSFVGPEYSRFDFTHAEGLTRDQLEELQRDVNRMILSAMPVETEVLALEEAKKRGAIAPFGEKYGARVRVVFMGDKSMEFCGGTHVRNTAEIGRFRITGESSIASGIRRIEAVTADEAMEQELEEHYKIVAPLESALAARGPEIVDRVYTLQSRVKELEKELARVKQDAAIHGLGQYAEDAIEMPGGVKLAAIRMDAVEPAQLRAVATALCDKIGKSGLAVIITNSGGKVSLAAAAGEDARKDYPAGQVVNKLAAPLGGRGGGKPDFAQGGAKDASQIDDVLARAAALLQ